MNKQYDISFEDCEFIFNKMEFYLSNGISISHRYNDPIMSIDKLHEEIDASYHGDKVMMLNSMLNSGCDWDFNCKYDNSDIKNEMLYPWCQNFSLILRSYFSKRFDRSDLNRYFEMLDNNLPELKTKIQERYMSYHGSAKWIDSAKTWTENVKKILSNALRKITVDNVEIEEGQAGNSYFCVKFYFNEKLAYQQKRKMEEVLNAKLLPIYNSCNNSAMRNMKQFSDISYSFADNGRKCNAAQTIIFKLRSNKWSALGMSEEAQFVPKMGMKRKLSL